MTRLKVNTATTLDTNQSLTSMIEIFPRYDFATPEGNSIGVVTDTVWDTTFWKCMVWNGENCVSWAEVDPDTSAYDSITVTDSLVGYVDTTKVLLLDGSVTVRQRRICDFDEDEKVDISDLTHFIVCLFVAPENCATTSGCDYDNSGTDDIADLTMLISYLFLGGPGP